MNTPPVLLWTSSELQVSSWYPSSFCNLIPSLGFGYNINAIEQGNTNELAHSFWTLFDSVQDVRIRHVLANFFPILRYLVSISENVFPYNHNNLPTMNSSLTAQDVPLRLKRRWIR